MDETRFGESHQTSSLVLGLVCGAAVGAALGLLFAPKVGSELRRDLAAGAGRLRRRAQEAMEHGADSLHRGMDHAARFAEETGDRVQRAARRTGTLDPARGPVNESRRQGNGSESLS
jgi:gas vesicle protein